MSLKRELSKTGVAGLSVGVLVACCSREDVMYFLYRCNARLEVEARGRRQMHLDYTTRYVLMIQRLNVATEPRLGGATVLSGTTWFQATAVALI